MAARSPCCWRAGKGTTGAHGGPFALNWDRINLCRWGRVSSKALFVPNCSFPTATGAPRSPPGTAQTRHPGLALPERVEGGVPEAAHPEPAGAGSGSYVSQNPMVGEKKEGGGFFRKNLDGEKHLPSFQVCCCA